MGKNWQLLWLLVAVAILTGCVRQTAMQKQKSGYIAPEVSASGTAPEFPCTLPDGIVAEAVIPYSGEYLEDGSGEQVENVAALLVYNPTQQLLSFGAFAVEQNGKTLYFFVHRLPPESRCLVLEYGKTICGEGDMTACRELRVCWEHPEFSREQVDYVCLGKEMTVINRDTRELAQVTVWYKRYDKAGQYYLGGIAYAAYFHNMHPEERRSVFPEYYDAAAARIVGIELKI